MKFILVPVSKEREFFFTDFFVIFYYENTDHAKLPARLQSLLSAPDETL